MTDALLRCAPFDFTPADKAPGGAFYEAVGEELRFHYENNPAYRRFCERKSFDPRGFSGPLTDVPPVQVSVFKELGGALASVPKEDIRLTLQSSATSGTPSSVPVDRLTSKRQARAMVRVIGDVLGNERRPFLVMDVDPAAGFRAVLGARYAAVSGYLNFASEVSYFLRVDDRGLYSFDTEGIRAYAESAPQDTPVVVFGFTYILYAEVLRPLLDSGARFRLPPGSKLIHIGGWKKLENEKIGKAAFDRAVGDLFGIAEEDIFDIYGFTEQMGLNYPDCRCGCKHAPLYSEVIVRDVATKEPLPPGRSGLLEFVTPIPHSYPGVAVLTDDIGVTEAGPCPFGRAGTRFRVLGRLKKAEVRGCGDILSEKLRFTAAEVPAGATGRELAIDYIDGAALPAGEPEERLAALEGVLRARLPWLMEQPVDMLIGLISQTAQKWGSADDPALRDAALATRGLSFLTSWCSAENLTRIATDGLRGSRMHADAFVPAPDDPVGSLRAVPRGLVCHWLAGNVQVLGMFVLIQSILTKNVNLLRVSSRDNGVFAALLRSFRGERFVSPGGREIAGDDLLRTVAVVSYDHASAALGRRMSAMADARIAWGGRDAITAVCAYPSRFGCSDIIMGPKLSFSVVARESLGDEHAAKKLARRVSVDASVFDQTGCASTHNVFVERGGAVPPEAFAALLGDGMAKSARQIPVGAMTPEEVAAVHSVRGIYDFKGVVYGAEDASWTVLYDEEDALHPPVYSRVVFVHPVDSIDDALAHVTEDIQTIGLAAPADRAEAFALRAAERGAVRFPACGRMLNFQSPWDGMFITDRLVRWITLGGPLV